MFEKLVSGVVDQMADIQKTKKEKLKLKREEFEIREKERVRREEQKAEGEQSQITNSSRYHYAVDSSHVWDIIIIA